MAREKPSTRQIEYFLAVAECASFRKAAERLLVSQPTLTSQIGALERLLKLRLFERSRAGTRLSPAGRELLAHAQGVTAELDAMLGAAAVLRDGAAGTFRLGISPTLGPYVLPHLLPALHERYGKLKLYVREEVQRELEAGLIAGRHDLVLCPMPIESESLAVTPLFREPIKLVVREDHPLASRSPLRMEDLRGLDILTIEEHHRFYRQVELLCQRIGARLLRDYQGTTLDALRHMVVMGMGQAFLPALYVLSEIREDSQLQVCDLSDEPVFRSHALVWRPSSPARSLFQRLAGDIRDILASRLGHVITALA